jgi:hypothetical protein
LWKAGLMLWLMVFSLSGCGRHSGPPPPLPAGEMASALKKGFESARPGVRDEIAKILSDVEGKDYPTAYSGLQALFGNRNLTDAQRTLAARASLTVSGLLQTAGDQGDEKAAAFLKDRLRTK